MIIRANVGTEGLGWHRKHMVGCLAAYVALVLLALTIRPAAATEGEVRDAFQRFVAAQNAHDLKEVESLLLESPNFLWITRGTPIWGRDDAVKRFSVLYKGTWRLEPDDSGLKIMMIGDAAAQIYVPILFTIGAPGQQAQQMRFLFNQVLVKTAGGWKVSSILPIPAPTQ
jgi:ketosteroid isomerase-like protein